MAERIFFDGKISDSFKLIDPKMKFDPTDEINRFIQYMEKKSANFRQETRTLEVSDQNMVREKIEDVEKYIKELKEKNKKEKEITRDEFKEIVIKGEEKIHIVMANIEALSNKIVKDTKKKVH